MVQKQLWYKTITQLILTVAIQQYILLYLFIFTFGVFMTLIKTHLWKTGRPNCLAHLTTMPFAIHLYQCTSKPHLTKVLEFKNIPQIRKLHVKTINKFVSWLDIIILNLRNLTDLNLQYGPEVLGQVLFYGYVIFVKKTVA